MLCVPTVIRLLVLKTALPPLMVTRMGVPPSTLKPTCPGGATVLEVLVAATSAVKDTDCPYTDGLAEDVSVTVVGESTYSPIVAELVAKTVSPEYWAWTVACRRRQRSRR